MLSFLRAPMAAVAVMMPLFAGIPAPVLAQTLPGYGRPLSPAEGRDLRASITRLSSQLRVREATLYAVADRVGVDLKGQPFGDILKLLETKAVEAAALKQQVAALEARVATLTDPTVRDPAGQHLKLAAAAIDAGRLDDADKHLAAVADLRWPQTLEARQAWLDAVRNRAALARLRLDEDAAASLLRSARLEERRLSTITQWTLAMDEADALYEKGRRRGDINALRQAIAIFREEAEALAPRAERPLDWAATQTALGSVLRLLGERTGDPADIEAAIVAYRSALEEATREREPQEWAKVQNNLGNALGTLGQRERATTRLQEAVDAYRAALEVRTRASSPRDFAAVQVNLGTVLTTMAQRASDPALMREAITAYRASLEGWDRVQYPLEWAQTQNNLGNALLVLGDWEGGTAGFEAAAAAYRAALEERTRERAPLEWAITQSNLGNTYLGLGDRRTGTADFELAVVAYSAALTELSPKHSPLDRAATQNNLGSALTFIGERTGDRARLQAAVDLLRQSIDGRPRDRVPLDWAMAQSNLGNALIAQARLESGVGGIEAAVTAYRNALEERRQEREPLAWARTTAKLAEALELQFDRTGKKRYLDEALKMLVPVPDALAKIRADSDLAATRAIIARLEGKRR